MMELQVASYQLGWIRPGSDCIMDIDKEEDRSMHEARQRPAFSFLQVFERHPERARLFAVYMGAGSLSFIPYLAFLPPKEAALWSAITTVTLAVVWLFSLVDSRGG